MHLRKTSFAPPRIGAAISYKHRSAGGVEVCGVSVPPTGTVRDFGIGLLLEADMQLTGHVSSRCFRQQRIIKNCTRPLPLDAAKTAVVCFVITQVDRCNSLGVVHKGRPQKTTPFPTPSPCPQVSAFDQPPSHFADVRI